MFRSSDGIGKAERILLSGEDSLKGRLFGAGKDFWSAMLARDTWPPPLTRAADDMIETLFARGDMRATIDAMDEPAARQAAARLLRFCIRFRECSAGSAGPVRI